MKQGLFINRLNKNAYAYLTAGWSSEKRIERSVNNKND